MIFIDALYLHTLCLSRYLHVILYKTLLQICGNDDSVKLLSEWLQTWNERGKKGYKDTSGCDVRDPEYDLQWDSDSENNSEETSIKNVLLITGPVGVLKIYLVSYILVCLFVSVCKFLSPAKLFL